MKIEKLNSRHLSKKSERVSRHDNFAHFANFEVWGGGGGISKFVSVTHWVTLVLIKEKYTGCERKNVMRLDLTNTVRPYFLFGWFSVINTSLMRPETFQGDPLFYPIYMVLYLKCGSSGYFKFKFCYRGCGVWESLKTSVSCNSN